MALPALSDFLNDVAARNAHKPEYLQAVAEVMQSVWPFLQVHPEYTRQGLLYRLTEPDRSISFRVAWLDDREQVQVNRGYRIQHSCSIGPYKGGLRFHPSVNTSILQFLAFEQTFKNALTTLPMGGAKGGSDFNPKGRSDEEIMRFCQAFIQELHRYIGENVDVPAGDIGVGAREIGYMTGMMKKLAYSTAASFTGKGLSFGGSRLRTEATGYGLVYFVEAMLKQAGRALEGQRVLVSGSGNVAQYAIERAMLDGAKVLTASDSDGTAYLPGGFNAEQLALLKTVKNEQHGRIKNFAEQAGAEYLPGQTPWHIAADIALPCATQNELQRADAETLVKNGVFCVAEGANMPCTSEAVDYFKQAGILYAPGKASNAGGVATSGLEMSQDAIGLMWSREEVNQRLQAIMQNIHQTCLEYGSTPNGISYADGANIGGFVKVAEAMLQQGVV